MWMMVRKGEINQRRWIQSCLISVGIPNVSKVIVNVFVKVIFEHKIHFLEFGLYHYDSFTNKTHLQTCFNVVSSKASINTLVWCVYRLASIIFHHSDSLSNLLHSYIYQSALLYQNVSHSSVPIKYPENPIESSPDLFHQMNCCC